MAFKPVRDGGDKFKFANPGDTLEGYYLSTEEVEINGDPAIRHTFKTAEGIKSVLGATALNQQLEEVTPNTKVRITFGGKKKNPKSGRMYNAFSVEQDADDILAVGAGAPVAQMSLKTTA